MNRDDARRGEPTPQRIALNAAVRRSPRSQSQIAQAAGTTKRTLQRYLDGTRTPDQKTHDAVIRACNLTPSISTLLAEHAGDSLIGSPSHIWLQNFISFLVPNMLEFDENHSMPIDPRSAAYCANLVNAAWIGLHEKRLKMLSDLYDVSSGSKRL
jgi:hypothetical protein